MEVKEEHRRSSVEGVVELVGELVVFPPVNFTHHVCDSSHGRPAEETRSIKDEAQQQQ